MDSPCRVFMRSILVMTAGTELVLEAAEMRRDRIGVAFAALVESISRAMLSEGAVPLAACDARGSGCGFPVLILVIGHARLTSTCTPRLPSVWTLRRMRKMSGVTSAEPFPFARTAPFPFEDNEMPTCGAIEVIAPAAMCLLIRPSCPAGLTTGVSKRLSIFLVIEGLQVRYVATTSDVRITH